ncbi:MAG: DNA translocase FtsK, partial [Bacilli bacterium]|nr:DNA translocase FtsK [Bacilli bacterium]
MSKKDKFYIAKIEEEKEKEVKPSKFATPYSGTKAKDESTFPYVKYGNEGRQYQDFKDSKDSEDIDIVYTGEDKEVDKYDPSRIPSWLRAETDSGISKSNLSDLKGEKPSEEEVLERNRQMYGTTYQDAIRQAEEERLRKEAEQKSVETIIDPINLDNPRYDIDEDGNVNEELFKDEPPKYEEVVRHSAFDGYEKTTIEERIIEEPKEYKESEVVDNSVIDEVEEEKETYVKEVKVESERPSTITDDYGDVVPRVPVHKMPRERSDSASSGLIFGNPKARYVTPPLELLKRNGEKSVLDTDAVNYQISVINRTFEDFKVGGKVITYTKGPTVTQFEVKLDPGVNVNKVTSLQRNLQMNLESESIRIQAPIPGKSTIGIEAPNLKKDVVLFGDLVSDPKFLKDGKPLNVILGLSIDGESVSADIAEMPHGLIAGATGSGKTVCMYSMILSMIYKASPEEVKMILVDPKRNELIYFEDIPHLATPIVDDPKLATAALKWAVDEMDRRYDFLKANRKRTIADYNAYAKANGMKIIPYIVIVIDEFADLMGTAS